MSDRVERAVEAVNAGQNVTRIVNSELTREEQLQFARRLWDSSENARSNSAGVWTRDMGGAEIRFRTVGGERQVDDIVFNGRDIYDTPQESATRQGREQAAARRREAPASSGIGADDRYRGQATAAAQTEAEATQRGDYQRCLDGGDRRRVDEAVCGAVTGYTPPGMRRNPTFERTGPGASAAQKLPALELVDSTK